MGLHEIAQLLHCILQLANDDRSLVHQPDFLGRFSGLARKQRNGIIDRILLLTEVKDIAVGLGIVEDTIGTRKRLNQPVVLQILVHIQGIEELGIETGEQHVHHDDDINFLRMGQIRVRVLLIFDALLDILIVEIKLTNAVVGAVLGVVVGNDAFKGSFLFVRSHRVVGLFLRQVFLNLLHILVAVRWRRKHTDDIQRLIVRACLLQFGLLVFESGVIVNRIIDGCGRQNRIELAPSRGTVVLGQNGFNDLLLLHRLTWLGLVLTFWFEIVHMKSQHIAIFNSMGNGVGVQLLLKNILRSLIGCLLAFNLLIAGIGFKDRCASESEQLSVGEKFLDGLVVVTEL